MRVHTRMKYNNMSTLLSRMTFHQRSQYRKLDQNDVDLKPYTEIFAEFTSVEGMVLRGERIVIPSMLRDKTVEIAHEGHQGMVRTKQILKARVWLSRNRRPCTQSDSKVYTLPGCLTRIPQRTSANDPSTLRTVEKSRH